MERVRLRISNTLRTIDRFGQKVSLTFNKSDSFDTIIGGIGTLAMYVIVILVGIMLLIEMFQKTSISATQTFIYRNLDNSTDKYQIGRNGVIFALRVQNVNGSVADDSIGTFRVEERAYIGIPDDLLVRNITYSKEIELTQCTKDSDFVKVNKVKPSYLMKCFKRNDYFIGGRDFSYGLYSLIIHFSR
jgi:hypothetical protein